jgi:hypothetical protein
LLADGCTCIQVRANNKESGFRVPVQNMERKKIFLENMTKVFCNLLKSFTVHITELIKPSPSARAIV